MTEDRKDRAERTSLGDVVLWMALAALVAIVIIGVATLVSYNPHLSSVAWPDHQGPLQPRIAQ
jgi:hypothetical protein